MQNLAVHWHEGLFLRPHHLQAWDRHWHEHQTASERWESPYSYGVASVRINPDALAAGFFQLDSIRAKMPEGTLVELSSGEPTERVDLRGGLSENDSTAASIPMQGGRSVDVFLAVPRLQLGAANVAENETTAARYRPLQVHVPDESDGSSVEPILFRRMNVKLMLSTDDLAGYDTLRIARLRRGTTGGAIAELDDQYIPPLLDCGAWPQMRHRMLSPIHDLLMRKAETLAQLVNDQNAQLDATQPGDLQRILMLQALNRGTAIAGVLNQSGGLHPWLAYLELARIAAELDLFTPQRAAQPIAPYDHDALGPLFHSLRMRIESRIASIGQNAYQQRLLIGSGMGMQVTLDPQWLMPNWRLVLGVRRGSISVSTLESLLAPGRLDWKWGSARQVEMLYSRRAAGVSLTRMQDIPRSLPSQSDWTYYEFGERGPAWNDVLESGTIAIRLPEEYVDNRSELTGNQTLRVRIDDEIMPLQFAVFALDQSAQE